MYTQDGARRKAGGRAGQTLFDEEKSYTFLSCIQVLQVYCIQVLHVYCIQVQLLKSGRLYGPAELEQLFCLSTRYGERTPRLALKHYLGPPLERKLVKDARLETGVEPSTYVALGLFLKGLFRGGVGLCFTYVSVLCRG